jgi:hypothetical protein
MGYLIPFLSSFSVLVQSTHNNAGQSRYGPGSDAMHGSARKRGLIAIFAIDLLSGSHMNTQIDHIPPNKRRAR